MPLYKHKKVLNFLYPFSNFSFEIMRKDFPLLVTSETYKHSHVYICLWSLLAKHQTVKKWNEVQLFIIKYHFKYFIALLFIYFVCLHTNFICIQIHKLLFIIFFCLILSKHIYITLKTIFRALHGFWTPDSFIFRYT